MASPLSYFRKYQYVMLVGFGVLLMFAFVVGPYLQDYLQTRAREAGDPLILKWAHGDLRRSNMERMRSLHYRTMNFLQGVEQLAYQNNGFPSPNITRLRRASSEPELIERMLLAQKATDQGLLINDEAIDDYLMQLSDRTLKQSDTEKLLKESNITLNELYGRLRVELLAENMDSIYWNATPVPTPAEVWKVHGRMARRVEAEILPISVASFRDQVNAEPSDSDLRPLFEEGRSRYPDPDSPLPGFRIRQRLRLAYVKADFNKFLEEARKTVTEEEIRER